MPIISNSIQNNGGSSQGIRSQTRTYRSGNSTLHLREGQTLRGVISDIHGNDITLSMEDGSSFTGQLPDANQYSIGQKAAFLITGLENNTMNSFTLLIPEPISVFIDVLVVLLYKTIYCIPFQKITGYRRSHYEVRNPCPLLIIFKEEWHRCEASLFLF